MRYYEINFSTTTSSKLSPLFFVQKPQALCKKAPPISGSLSTVGRCLKSCTGTANPLRQLFPETLDVVEVRDYTKAKLKRTNDFG